MEAGSPAPSYYIRRKMACDVIDHHHRKKFEKHSTQVATIVEMSHMSMMTMVDVDKGMFATYKQKFPSTSILFYFNMTLEMKRKVMYVFEGLLMKILFSYEHCTKIHMKTMVSTKGFRLILIFNDCRTIHLIKRRFLV